MKRCVGIVSCDMEKPTRGDHIQPEQIGDHNHRHDGCQKTRESHSPDAFLTEEIKQDGDQQEIGRLCQRLKRLAAGRFTVNQTDQVHPKEDQRRQYDRIVPDGVDPIPKMPPDEQEGYDQARKDAVERSRDGDGKTQQSCSPHGPFFRILADCRMTPVHFLDTAPLFRFPMDFKRRDL
jgi:hypothetical protein